MRAVFLATARTSCGDSRSVIPVVVTVRRFRLCCRSRCRAERGTCGMRRWRRGRCRWWRRWCRRRGWCRCDRRRRWRWDEDTLELRRLHAQRLRLVLAQHLHLDVAAGRLFAQQAQRIFRAIDFLPSMSSSTSPDLSALSAVVVGGQHQHAVVGAEIAAEIGIEAGQVQAPPRRGEAHVAFTHRALGVALARSPAWLGDLARRSIAARLARACDSVEFRRLSVLRSPRHRVCSKLAACRRRRSAERTSCTVRGARP